MKPTGGTRIVNPTKATKDHNRCAILHESSMSDVDAKESYFSEKSGGYLIAMNGHKFKDEEREAMKAMADAGFIVVATPEKGDVWISTRTKDGNPKYSDGLLMGNVFEQKTPKPKGVTQDELNQSVKKALGHALEKKAKIAVIYDKYESYHRHNIEAGMNEFERHNDYRFKAILVVDSKGKIHEHIHNS